MHSTYIKGIYVNKICEYRVKYTVYQSNARMLAELILHFLYLIFHPKNVLYD